VHPCTGSEALYRPTAHWRSRGIALLFLDHGTRRRWGVSATLRPLFTPRKPWYPLYRRLGGPQGRSGQVRKNLASTGIRSPDVQPVASRYSDYATRLTSHRLNISVKRYNESVIREHFSWFNEISNRRCSDKKLKLSYYRSGQALRFPGGWVSQKLQIFGTRMW